MRLDELKTRLGTTNATDAQLQLLLNDATHFVELQCGEYNDAAAPVVMKHVKYALHDTGNVRSESLAGMSQTFASQEEMQRALTVELSKLGLRRIRFIPLGR